MRLLMTTDTVGGVWTFACELTREMLGRGHAVHLVSFGRRPSADQEAFCSELRERFPDRFGFTASEIPLEWMQNNEHAYTDGEALLRDVIGSIAKPDLILANQFCFGRLATDVPRVVCAHSDVLSWARVCRPSALEPSPWLNRYTSLVQAGLLNATAVVAPTAWMGKALAANFFLPNNYTVIPNGASLQPSPADQPERRLQAIMAGRLWDGAKGLDTLTDCELPLPLLLAGETRLEDQSCGSLPANTRVLGALSSAALQGVFRESAIYLCASRYEPFGLTPVEAALCGCAVVARDLPSLREIWGEDALYFKDRDGLRTQLLRLTTDEPSLYAAQARAQGRAATYTVARMTDSYLALFASLQHSEARRVA